ncbi:GMP synthase [Paenibacillus sp. GSMTC-2017]|uniref:glutamine amidotransferase-related protein n=1 Tax=Paenibacillus sp. GSMTC-2017 TaxID=2794350 RepID=UPI0018D6ABE2|nr:GMP synthase [Paenibacillus sp. GSMTC-2017]MBH5319463.1 GMP synthase [Paenibacillus sp. GSMTC-2017]
MRIHFIIHELFEGPGAFQIWAEERGHHIEYSRLYAGEALPTSPEEIDLLLVLGGPQSTTTTLEECPHFDAAAEIALINRFIQANKAVIGVCLGAQLIGEALGARCERSPEKEIGNFPIFFTEDSKNNPKFIHFGETCTVGHWHNDMPGLTDDCTIIAYSEACPRQIIQYNERVYGFQCHMEFTKELIELLIAHSEAQLSEQNNNRFVQQPDQLKQYDYTLMNRHLFIFLDELVEEIVRK